jgi:hypothetical protein
MTFNVYVTRDDIDAGTPGDNRKCAISRAVHRALSNAGVEEKRGWIDFDDPGVPSIVLQFVKLFDDAAIPRELLAPFTFTLTVADQHIVQIVGAR